MAEKASKDRWLPLEANPDVRFCVYCRSSPRHVCLSVCLSLGLCLSLSQVMNRVSLAGISGVELALVSYGKVGILNSKRLYKCRKCSFSYEGVKG